MDYNNINNSTEANASGEFQFQNQEVLNRVENQPTFNNPEQPLAAEKINTLPNPQQINPDNLARVSQIPVSSVVREPISVGERFRKIEAADSDIIESSWVSGTKKVLSDTKGRPFERNNQIEEIRKIYQAKRKEAA